MKAYPHILHPGSSILSSIHSLINYILNLYNRPAVRNSFITHQKKDQGVTTFVELQIHQVQLSAGREKWLNHSLNNRCFYWERLLMIIAGLFLLCVLTIGWFSGKDWIGILKFKQHKILFQLCKLKNWEEFCNKGIDWKHWARSQISLLTLEGLYSLKQGK